MRPYRQPLSLIFKRCVLSFILLVANASLSGDRSVNVRKIPMNMRFLLMAFTIYILYPVAIFADEPDNEHRPAATRWGITTKKNLQSPPQTASDDTGSISHTKTEKTAAPTPTGEPAASVPETSKVPTDSVREAPANTSALDNISPAEKKASTKNQAPNSGAPSPAKPSTTEAGKKTAPQPISWSSEEQKKRCNGHLKDLRSLFLKTRHYSIQGASCDTAESATAFLRTMETCKQDCPQGLLEQSGYTGRIIRNIKYLEKLGNDRCSGSLKPVPPVTQKP